MILYEQTCKREVEKFKVLGSMLGVGTSKPETTSNVLAKTFAAQAKQDTMLFGDPKDYKNLNPEEGEARTLKMQLHWEKELTGKERESAQN